MNMKIDTAAQHAAVDGLYNGETSCPETSVTKLLTQSGNPTTEGEVVRRAINCSTWRMVA